MNVCLGAKSAKGTGLLIEVMDKNSVQPTEPVKALKSPSQLGGTNNPTQEATQKKNPKDRSGSARQQPAVQVDLIFHFLIPALIEAMSSLVRDAT